jgi:hypothetical protein
MGKTFELGDVLTITTGKLVARGGMNAVYNILNYMTDDTLFTHQLPRAMDECRPYLLKQFPQLADMIMPEDFGGKAGVLAWLWVQEQAYGNSFEVEPIPQDDHTFKDPVTELVELVGPDKAIIVSLPEEQAH